MRPLIGVASSAFYDSFTDTLFDCAERGVVETCWQRLCLTGKMLRHIRMAGGAAELLSVKSCEDEIETDAEKYDAFLFCGGADINPALYGEEPDGSLDMDAQRDAFEYALMKKAYEKGKTIFGICRGQQMMNIVFGGTIHQDINRMNPDWTIHQTPYPMDGYAHTVNILEPRFLPPTGGAVVKVNSAHHQAIDRLAEGFIVTAATGDGIIEGIAMPGYEKGLIGVQWHPESLADKDMFHHNFFKMLVEYAAK
ncbi:MAG TPA: gamma-glutamyl-gamma-aminobutyrate hydrolase family protein [Candidatus Caccocola faecipullorum]|nr:gamma-glutamyl-gamma-aminobutyrate hydrolase family protein [Candidatus Caccocola faecipullorum]